MVEFGSWLMPIQYTAIIEEHNAVRNNLGVFDISHMGQFFASGAGAAAWLNRLLSNNIDRLSVGECQYTFLLNENGGVIDDLIAYRIGDEHYLLVVNAAKIDEDYAWMHERLEPGVTFENSSSQFAGFAVQGPKSVQLFDAFFEGRYSRPARNEILSIELKAAPYYIARTGYTGEDGFEVFCPADRAIHAWRDILERGAPFGIKPCGLGARDTLRLEMCYPLNGSDLSPSRTPLEAGLSIFVDLQKGDFIGRNALVEQKGPASPIGWRHFACREKLLRRAHITRSSKTARRSGKSRAARFRRVSEKESAWRTCLPSSPGSTSRSRWRSVANASRL